MGLFDEFLRLFGVKTHGLKTPKANLAVVVGPSGKSGLKFAMFANTPQKPWRFVGDRNICDWQWGPQLKSGMGLVREELVHRKWA
jgi:hypothetical protein